MISSSVQNDGTPLKQAIKQYHRDGFGILRSVVTGPQVREVLSLVEPMFTDFAEMNGQRCRDVGAIGDVEPGTQQPEVDRATVFQPALLKSELYLAIKDVATAILGKEAHYVFDHVICKKPHSVVETAWHQDRGYMKMNVELETINFWVPFQPVSSENGALSYAPGSHNGPLIPHRRDPDSHPHVLKADMPDTEIVTPQLEVGDICFHHPMTLHGAGKNDTDSNRYAWSIHFGCYGRFEYLKPSNIARMFSKGFPRLLSGARS